MDDCGMLARSICRPVRDGLGEVDAEIRSCGATKAPRDSSYSYHLIKRGASGVRTEPLPRIQVKSIITSPRSGASLPAGTIEVSGLAAVLRKMGVFEASSCRQTAVPNGKPCRLETDRNTSGSRGRRTLTQEATVRWNSSRGLVMRAASSASRSRSYTGGSLREQLVTSRSNRSRLKDATILMRIYALKVILLPIMECAIGGEFCTWNSKSQWGCPCQEVAAGEISAEHVGP